jgi:hypothetical protein
MTARTNIASASALAPRSAVPAVLARTSAATADDDHVIVIPGLRRVIRERSSAHCATRCVVDQQQGSSKRAEPTRCERQRERSDPTDPSPHHRRGDAQRVARNPSQLALVESLGATEAACSRHAG